MASLTAVEEGGALSPLAGGRFAVVGATDEKRGEEAVLVTTLPNLDKIQIVAAYATSVCRSYGRLGGLLSWKVCRYCRPVKQIIPPCKKCLEQQPPMFLMAIITDDIFSQSGK